jgi:hypothetical protein
MEISTSRAVIVTSALLAVSALASGCATVPQLSDQGSKVRQISADDAKHCKFLQTIQYMDTVQGVGKSYGLVHQAGDIGLRNAIGAAGGNAFVSAQADADWFFGHVNYSGEAYRCPEQ